MPDKRTPPPQDGEPGTGNVPPKRSTVKGGNPFKNGFQPNGKRKKQPGGFMNKKSLLKHMLEVDITVQDLPVKMADYIREKMPGFLEKVERKFTMRQILELVQIQLLFSRSDYVKQDAIEAIKNRVEGKPMQKIQVESLEAEPTQFILPGGRAIII